VTPVQCNPVNARKNPSFIHSFVSQCQFAVANALCFLPFLSSVPALKKSCSVQPDLDPIRTAVSQRQVVPHDRIRFQILHLVESLQESHRHVAGFREGKLLADADARASVELYVVRSINPSVNQSLSHE
jgi:hypothetical protein